MISKALQFTAGTLDRYLQQRLGSDESKVQLNNLIDSNGTIPKENTNKVVISLINIERETARPFYTRNARVQEHIYADIRQSQRFNLDILVSSNFDDYGETLKLLDQVIVFFQVNTCMDSYTYPSMPEGIGKLEIDNDKIGYYEMQNLWTAMGAKYRPSIVYKMRLITIQANEADMFVPAITETSTGIRPL